MVAVFPFPRPHPRVAPDTDGTVWLVVHCEFEIGGPWWHLNPFRHPYEKTKRCRFGHVEGQCSLTRAGKLAALSERNLLTVQLRFQPGIFERIDHQQLGSRGFRFQVRRLHRQNHAARAARMTAGDSRVEWFLSFESRVVAPIVPAWVLSGGQMVVERSLEFVAVLCFARQSQKLKVELDPGGRDARLTNVRTHLIGQDMIALKMLARADAAGDVQTVRDDVVPGVPHRL